MGNTASTLPDGLVRNRIGLSQEHLKLLWEALKPLSKVDARLAERAIRYVVDEEEDPVLSDLTVTGGCGKALGLIECGDITGIERPVHGRLIKARPSDDPAFYLRLAKIYQAAAAKDRPAHVVAHLLGHAKDLPNLVSLLIAEAAGTSHHFGEEDRIVSNGFPAELAERIVVAAGGAAESLVRTVISGPISRYYIPPAVLTIAGMEGFGKLLARHAPVVVEGLMDKEADRRRHTLRMLRNCKADITPFLGHVIDLAVGSAKKVREEAENLIKAHRKQCVPPLQKKAEAGSNDERFFAVQTLWKICGAEMRPFLQARMEQDRAARVKALISELLQEQKESAEQEEASLPLPPVQRPPQCIPLSQEAREAVAQAVRKDYAILQRHHQQYPKFQIPAPPTEGDIAGIVRYFESGEAEGASYYRGNGFGWSETYQLVNRADFHLLHCIRLVHKILWNHDFAWFQLRSALTRYLAEDPTRTLRDAAAVLEVCGKPVAALGQSMFVGYAAANNPLLALKPEAIWPYFAEHPQILEQAWQKKEGYDYWHNARHRAVLKVLATFPKLPPSYVRMLWDTAFNGIRKDRPLAQETLARVPDKEQRILSSLIGGKAEHRAIAAEWLGELGYAPAISAIRDALKKEKNDLAAGAMMVALEKLGVPLEEFVSVDGLLKEARALIEKGVPKEQSWLSFERLPRVHWAKDGKPVRREILQWMVLQSFKLASPDPSPRLRQYASYLNRADAEELGQYVLEAWMAQDLVPPSHEDAEAYAKQQTAHMAHMVKQYPQYAQYYQPPAQGWFQKFYQDKINQPIGSAIKEKGILAIAAACCGGRAAAPIQRYLKTWYGMRVHQCRALIAVLSWIDHPSAIQVLLSVAARFRTASLRAEAERCVNEVAERKHWTLDELADRTIPTAGFDENRQLVIDYGKRKFIAKLDNDLGISLASEDGKPIKSLPDARQDEDEAAVKAAKKNFSAAKKELQGVLKLQKERLYEAMCTQRTWTLADWNNLLGNHPIVGSYCQRLIWAVKWQEKPVATFRPLGDGTFTDAADEPVTLSGEDTICLAHQCLLPAELAAAWQQHFADYEVRPLFQQLGQTTFALSQENRQETEIGQFKGHMLDAFALRGMLTKRGYTRGQAQDGGWFCEYHKQFPGQGLRATIEFSGNGLPEENRKVALVSLRFHRTAGDGEEQAMMYWDGANGLPLSEIPAVLLSECYNDLRSAASEGTGFDPDWQKKAFA